MKVFTLLLFVFISQNCVNAQVMWQINKDTIIKWHYANGDEFNTNSLDTTKWKYWYGWARSIFQHKEQQYYTDGLNHIIKDGHLNLYAKKEKVEKRVVDWLDDTTSIYNGKINTGNNKRVFDYTSGMILSKQTYKYGYFEIKFKMPDKKGYWPAFWLHGGYPNEEIDWMELKTEKKSAIHVGRHSQKSEENRIRNYIRKKTWGDWVYFKGNLSKNWNIISGEWTPNYLKYYLNGECIAYTKISLNIDKVLCANLAVPGDGPFHPGPDKNDSISDNFKIDYIRVWSVDSNHTTLNNNVNFLSNTNTGLGITKLKSKTRFLYGRKKEHINEGITATLLPLENKKYEILILGKKIPETISCTIMSTDNKIIHTQNLKYGTNIIDVSNFTENILNLKITYLGQSVLYTIN